MKTRYKITRLNAAGEPELKLEECIAHFEKLNDFTYQDFFSVTQDGVNMKINGHFFMWELEGVQIPFRYFDNEVYVAVSHPVILEKTKEVAIALNALYIEG